MAPGSVQLEQIARDRDFSGVVRIWRRSEVVAEFASGLADRANRRANGRETRFAIASGTKAFTALTTMSLIESGH